MHQTLGRIRSVPLALSGRAYGRLALGVLVVASCVVLEAHTSFVQSLLLSDWADTMRHSVGSGPSPRIRFPGHGPYDERLGYTQLPSFIRSATSGHFVIERQAEMSPAMEDFTVRHGYALYREKPNAGLAISGRDGAPLYKATYPERVYKFAEIPPLVLSTLLFIENRTLLDPVLSRQNPAIEWQRFFLAVGGQIAGVVDSRFRRGGGSTLATQIEKFEHSPGGRTWGIGDKLQQMTAASIRAYADGPDTTEARKRIATAYLNSTPLGSRPGYGEIIGIADGLRAWYGTEFDEANKVLTSADPKDLPRKAEIYKQVLSLLIAQRRPSDYLANRHDALEILANSYLRILAQANVITPELRDAALMAPLAFRKTPPAPAPSSFIERKAANAIRTELLGLLKAPNLYSLDHYDLRVGTTIDAAVQANVSQLLARLRNPTDVKAFGLVGPNLLGGQDPSRVAYSVVLYERQPDRNVVRVHADSLEEPFDINTGAKLILGSTAKLRTLITYLNVVSILHERYAQATPAQLRAAANARRDPLSAWAAAYLRATPDHSLKPMLAAAMQRRYSASPSVFFTGGGQHVFHNFEKFEDRKIYTVEDGFANSVNLVFIRLLRDVASYYLAEREAQRPTPREQDESALRQAYLDRFVDKESRVYLNRFYAEQKKKTPDEILALLARKTRSVPSRLAVVFRTLRPDASLAQFQAFLKSQGKKGALKEKDVQRLYDKYSVDAFSLADRGYIARVHPLELWLGSYLQSHPDATRDEVAQASSNERREVYGWLYNSKRPRKQDVRIRIVREEDAFVDILKDWRAQGYPFDRLVPSLATAIGSSGDRPEALSHLMGIVLNDGIELPTTNLERLQFGVGTPYETDLAYQAPQPKRVMAPEIASVVRAALTKVVSSGTAKRLLDTFHADDGTPIALGGKTGTGDNRLEHFAANRRLISSEAVDRTATFVFYLGDRFYGTVTAFVRGPEAARYDFTSALSLQLLKALAPQLKPLLDRSPNPPAHDVATTSAKRG